MMIAWLKWIGIIYFGTIWAYPAVMHAKVLLEQGKLSTWWKIHLLPLGIIGFALDIVFNLTLGTFFFKERPKELLFSKRVQRQLKQGPRRTVARRWANRLNLFDPGHIRESETYGLGEV